VNTWNITKQLESNILGGEYLGGNAWLKPDGTGFSQTCEDDDFDGICDQEFQIDANNIDYLPLKVYQPPITNFTFYPSHPKVGETITFDASSSYDVDGSIIAYSWDFGDNSTAFGVLVSHAYSEPGNYTVMLTVTDNDRLESSISKLVQVFEEKTQSGDIDGNGNVDFNDLIVTLNLILAGVYYQALLSSS